MSAGPENRFIRGVHRLMGSSPHKEKMANPYRGGTFDVWYSGPQADLWIEYKWVAQLPKRGKLVPALSELQKEWGRGRFKEGRAVIVVVGSPSGGVWFPTPEQWEAGTEDCSKSLLTKPELADMITRLTTGEPLDAMVANAPPNRGRRRVRVQDPDHRVPDLRAGKVPVQ